MTRRIIIFFVLFVLVAVGIQAVAAVRESRLRAQATAAYINKDYAGALPLFARLADLVSDDPGQIALLNVRIAECRRNLRSVVAGTPSTPSAVASLPQLTAGRTPHAPPKTGEIRFLEIRQLGNFDYDPERGAPLPPDVKALNGLRLRTVGYMIPLCQAANVSEFALVPSLTACCYGAPPTIQHTLMVHMTGTTTAPYSQQPLVVEGTLGVKEQMEDGVPISLFTLRDAVLKW